MKSKSLAKEWAAYAATHGLTPEHFAGNTAIVYGSDEYKLDYAHNRVRLPNLGWVPANALDTSGDIEWVALIPASEVPWSAGQVPPDSLVLVVGRGSPFANEFRNVFPFGNGFMKLVPYAVLSK